VAVPNVTAIDWKQADVFGPGQDQQGGMSFTVREARAASVFSEFYLPASRGVLQTKVIRKIFAQQRTDETSAA
jgi:hypothetical protein